MTAIKDQPVLGKVLSVPKNSSTKSCFSLFRLRSKARSLQSISQRFAAAKLQQFTQLSPSLFGGYQVRLCNLMFSIHSGLSHRAVSSMEKFLASFTPAYYIKSHFFTFGF